MRESRIRFGGVVGVVRPVEIEGAAHLVLTDAVCRCTRRMRYSTPCCWAGGGARARHMALPRPTTRQTPAPAQHLQPRPSTRRRSPPRPQHRAPRTQSRAPALRHRQTPRTPPRHRRKNGPKPPEATEPDTPQPTTCTAAPDPERTRMPAIGLGAIATARTTGERCCRSE